MMKFRASGGEKGKEKLSFRRKTFRLSLILNAGLTQLFSDEKRGFSGKEKLDFMRLTNIYGLRIPWRSAICKNGVFVLGSRLGRRVSA